MADYPKHITLHEEGPREGFQFEKTIFPLAERARLIDALSETGLRQIQVASFVNPKMVPQMADAAELFATIRRKSGVRYTALWLNERGFEQARSTKGVDLFGLLLLHTSDAFSLRNNGCTADEMRARQERWITLYEEAGMVVEQVAIMTAFGCNLQGEIGPELLRQTLDWIAARFGPGKRPMPVICLADTVGWAVPSQIERRIGQVRDRFPDAEIALHLHDTRGAGIANFHTALRMGVSHFDGSVAGLGGCPFAGHSGSAAGNVCTEDMVFMAHELGIETGIDLDRLIEAANLAERIIGRPLAGRVMHSGGLAQYRHSPERTASA